MTTDTNGFPSDMFFSDEPQQAWSSLKEQTAAAMMKRIDLSYYVLLQESTKGTVGANERAALRLGMDSDEMKRGPQTVSDNAKIFRLFRATTDNGGLGMSRDELQTHSFRRLRVFAQNKDWARGNMERIPELLAQRELGEEKLRELINKERGVTARTGASDNTRLAFVLTLQDGMFVEEILEAAKRRRVVGEDPLPETGADGKKLSEDFLRGLLLRDILGDWLLNDSGMVDDDGVMVTNADFMTGGRFAADEEETPEATDDGSHVNAAD